MKIEFEKYKDIHEEKEIKGSDGTAIHVKSHIPWEKKQEMAEEYVNLVLAVHDDSVIYEIPGKDAVEMLLILKYYTDVEVDGVTSEEAADFLINNDMCTEVCYATNDDLLYVKMMAFDMIQAVKDNFADDKGLTKAIRTSFGFLFNGEDISESLAKAEAVKDNVYEMIGAWKKTEKEKNEKLSGGTLKMGGTLLNFAKRE